MSEGLTSIGGVLKAAEERVRSVGFTPDDHEMQWEIDEKIPRFDDVREFEVWIYGQARRVRRVGNRSMSITPGTLVFTDCVNPIQNVICDESLIRGWRLLESE